MAPSTKIAPVGGKKARVSKSDADEFYQKMVAKKMLSAWRGSIGIEKEPSEKAEVEVKLYSYRWVQLAYLSALAMISDLVCFSVAATPDAWEEVFHADAANMIDYFLFTNVAACFAEPFVIKRFGLRKPVIASGILMAVGSVLRSGIPFIGHSMPPYACVVLGTVCVGLAQPFFQCTPPMLSATWFAPTERALATACAINFNQVGIAIAFLLGGSLATSEEGIKYYFSIISVSAILVGVGTTLQFREVPPSPPSASAMEKASGTHEDLPFPQQALKLFKTKGFLHPLSAFICSIAITNIVGAFMGKKLANEGITDQKTINIAGASFEIMIVLGGMVLGSYVDHTKRYKSVTMFCLVMTFVFVILVGINKVSKGVALVALMGIGFLTGPVQPINAELAVDVTFPSDENAIEAVQQLSGNLLSAILVPICERAAREDFGSTRFGLHTEGDTVVMMLMILVVGAFYMTFNSPLKRTMLDQGEGHGESEGGAHSDPASKYAVACDESPAKKGSYDFNDDYDDDETTPKKGGDSTDPCTGCGCGIVPGPGPQLFGLFRDSDNKKRRFF